MFVTFLLFACKRLDKAIRVDLLIFRRTAEIRSTWGGEIVPRAVVPGHGPRHGGVQAEAKGCSGALPARNQ